jgi:outer membrane immunogenic protein
MLKKLSIATAMLVASSTVAFAATSGPYLGANIGVNSSKSTLSNSTSTTTPRTSSSNAMDLGSRGALAGVFGGYGVMVNQNVYLGGEAFANYANSESDLKANYSDATTNANGKYSLRQKYSYGLSFIPGFMVSEHTMAYGRAGIVQTRFENKASMSGSADIIPFGTSRSVNKVATGGQLGAGLQTDLMPNVALRGEYVYTAYRSFNGIGGKIKPSTDQVNLGLVYKFD